MSLEYLKKAGSDFLKREDVRHTVTKKALELLELKKHLNMHVEGREHLVQAGKLLEDHSGVATLNHNSIADYLPIVLLTQEYFPEGFQSMYPAASKFFTRTFENPFITDMIHFAAEDYNLQLFRTIQHGGHLAATGNNFSPGDENVNTTSNTQLESGNDLINSQMLRTIFTNLRSPKNLLVIAQEGGRSREGRMIKAARKIDNFVKPNSFVLPFAIWGTENIHAIGQKKFNPVKAMMAPVNVVVGEPLSYDQINEEAAMWNTDITTIASIHTAINLPAKYQGYYGPSNHVDIYNYYYANGRMY